MVNPARRDWRLVAAVAGDAACLDLVGRLQGRNLGAGEAGVPRSTRATVGTDDRPVASGLLGGDAWGTVTARIDPARLRLTARFGGQVIVVADGVLWSYLVRGDKFIGFGRVDADTLRPRRPLLVTDAVWTAAFEDRRVWRVPLGGGPARAVIRVPGHAYGLAADDGALWVLSALGEPGSGGDGSGRLRRLDRRTGAVTATTPLPTLDAGQDGVAIGLALGGGAVWLAGPYSRRSEASGILLRVDPVSGRVTGWLRDPRWFFQDVLAAGPRGAWVATTASELLHVLAA